MEETIEKGRRREKIMICIILMLAMLLMISVAGKNRGHAREGKLVLSLEWVTESGGDNCGSFLSWGRTLTEFVNVEIGCFHGACLS